jgi:hypothetical protein
MIRISSLISDFWEYGIFCEFSRFSAWCCRDVLFSTRINFVFTPSHGVMMGTDPNDPEADYMISLGFERQNGELVPVDPIKIMEEAGATITFPDWPGPWDDIS